MGIEIERKFLVNEELLKPLLPTGTHYEQGYLPTTDLTTVRVRIAGETGFLTVKGKTTGASRAEFEYEIPLTEAREMLDLFCETTVVKKRYLIPRGVHTFEVDIFEGENSGLILAEVELTSENEKVDIPNWITKEVTSDPRYYNSQLLINPISRW